MDKKENKFIITTFADTAKQLEELGFTLLSHSSGSWTFLNKKTPLNFQNIKGVALTDKITF